MTTPETDGQLNLATLRDGEAMGLIDAALEELHRDIRDLDKDPTAKRSLTVTLALTPDVERDMAVLALTIKTTLAPMKGLAAKVMIGHDGMSEYRSPQMELPATVVSIKKGG